MPQTSKETKNSLSLRKHAKYLRELTKFDIELTGNIEEILENPQEWAEELAISAILEEVPRYQKAKEAGERFAREITD